MMHTCDREWVLDASAKLCEGVAHGRAPGTAARGRADRRSPERRQISVREAARRAGISEGWWRQVVNGYQSLSGGAYGTVRAPAETLARMAQAAGVTADDLTAAGRADAA